MSTAPKLAPSSASISPPTPEPKSRGYTAPILSRKCHASQPVYTAHFRFRESPFSITPDPAFLYLSPRHHEALGYLLYGTGEAGGFVQLTGEVGTGKTTVVRTLLDQKLPGVDVALVLNPRQSVLEFVQSICDELGIGHGADASLKQLIDALNQHLLDAHAQGRRTVLIIDEAQNLSPELLEQVRLLTNLETAKHKLLRIMLVGQPELISLLERPDLRQLAQRITARFHLTALDADETCEYIAHRLRVAGGDADIFEPAALRAVHRHSGGIPRLINVICDRALLNAYADGSRQVTAGRVQAAAREAAPPPSRATATSQGITARQWQGLAIAAAGLLLVAVTAWWWLPTAPTPSAQAASPAANAPPAPAPSVDAAPASTAASPPTLSLDALLTRDDSLGDALEMLIGLWHIDLLIEAGDNVCLRLREEALECHRGEGGWVDIERLDRPVVLRLEAATGGSLHVLLTGLDAERIELRFADGAYSMARRDLDALWTGDYLTLWQRETDSELIRPGDQGAAVVWLRRALARNAGEPLFGEPSPVFDDALALRLRRFQQRNGLHPDGIAGALTQMLLVDDPAPSLKRPGAEG